MRDIKVQEKLIKEYLKDFEASKDTLEKVYSLNRKYNTMAEEEEEVARNINWSLKSFEWDNLFNYGEGNKLNFSKLHGIVGIFGKNYSGKSSIIDALLYTLFNSTSKNERKNLNVINQNKDYGNGKLEIQIGEKDQGCMMITSLEKEYPNAYQNYSLNNAELQKLSAAVLALYKNYDYLTTDNYYEFAQSEVIENKYFVDTSLNQFHLDWNFNNEIHEIKGKKNKVFKIKILHFSFSEPIELKINSEKLKFWCRKITDGFYVRWNGFEGNIKIYPSHLSSYFTIVPRKSNINNSKEIVSPMPGLLVSLDIGIGDKIEVGQRLCAIEAMKMENVIYSEISGIVKSINFKLGDIMSDGDTILEFV